MTYGALLVLGTEFRAESIDGVWLHRGNTLPATGDVVEVTSAAKGARGVRLWARVLRVAPDEDPPIQAVPEALNRFVVALTPRNWVDLTEDAREALLRRLRYVEEVPGPPLRDDDGSELPPELTMPRLLEEFEHARDKWPVYLAGFQRIALLNTLEEWSRDQSGYEQIPLDLVTLRAALIADVGDRGAGD